MSIGSGDSGNFSFQKRIKIERIKRGLFQEKLGEIIGISKGYVSKIETTNQEPSPAVKKLLQQWLREETSQKYQAPVDIQYDVGENIVLPPGVGLPGKNSKLERWHLVPLFGNVPAGFPSQITEPDIISYVAADMDVPKGGRCYTGEWQLHAQAGWGGHKRWRSGFFHGRTTGCSQQRSSCK